RRDQIRRRHRRALPHRVRSAAARRRRAAQPWPRRSEGRRLRRARAELLMADDAVLDPPEEPTEAPRRRSRAATALRWAGGILAALVLVVVVAIGWLHTGPGRQFIVDELSKVAPASGLTVEVGRIEGSVLWS